MFRSKSLLKCSQAIINQQLGNKTSGTSLYKSSNSFDGHVSNRIENLIHSLKDNSIRTNSEINSTKILKKTKSCNFLSQINNLNKTLGSHKLSSSCCTLTDCNTSYLSPENEFFSRITKETKIVYKDKNFNIELNKKYSVCNSSKYDTNKKSSFKYTSSKKFKIAHILREQKLNYHKKIKSGTLKKKSQHGKIQIQAYKLYNYVKNINDQVNINTIFSYSKISETISKKEPQNKKLLNSRANISLSEINLNKHDVSEVHKAYTGTPKTQAKFIKNGSINKRLNNSVYSTGARGTITLNAEFINRKINILPKYQSHNTITTTCNNAASTLKSKEIKTINSISNEKQYSLDGKQNEKVRSETDEDKFNTIQQDDSDYLKDTQEKNQISTRNIEEQLSIEDLLFSNPVNLKSTAENDLEINKSNTCKQECILNSIYTTPSVINYDKFSSEIIHNRLMESDLSKAERSLLTIYSSSNKYFKNDNDKIRNQQSKLCVEEKNTGTSAIKYEKQIEKKSVQDVNINKIRNTYSAVITKQDSNNFSKALRDSRSVTNQNNELRMDEKLHDDSLLSEKKLIKPEPVVAWIRGRKYQQLKSKIYYKLNKEINTAKQILNKNEMESVAWMKDRQYSQIKETKDFKQTSEMNKKENVENSTRAVGWIKGQNIDIRILPHKKASKVNYHPNDKEKSPMIFSLPINYFKGVKVTNSDIFGFTNSENCSNATTATAWMRNKYSKSENNLFNHFHEIKSTAPNNKNYSQAAFESNATMKEKSKFKQKNMKSDSKKDLKPKVTWEESTFSIDKEKPLVDLRGKKLLNLPETTNTDAKLDSTILNKRNVNENYQHINNNSKKKTVSTAVPWVRNQNTFKKDDITSKTLDKLRTVKHNWMPNLSPVQSSLSQIKQEKTATSCQYSEKKENWSLPHNKQSSKHEEAPVSNVLMETSTKPNSCHKTETKRAIDNNHIMARDTMHEPITHEKETSTLHKPNETRKNYAETKSKLLVIWKKDDKIGTEKEIIKKVNIADSINPTNVQSSTNINGQSTSFKKSKSNTLPKIPQTGVPWIRLECIANKDNNYFKSSDNITTSSKDLGQQKKLDKKFSEDSHKNLNEIKKKNEIDKAVALKLNLINDQNSFQSSYKNKEAENKLKEAKKLLYTDDNTKRKSKTASSAPEIALNSEIKNRHTNDAQKSTIKKTNSQISKERVTNETKIDFTNNITIQQNLKDSDGKFPSTTRPLTDKISKKNIKISSPNAAFIHEQIKEKKKITVEDCGIIKLQKQNDQFKKMLTFSSKTKKEGRIKAANSANDENFTRNKSEKIDDNNMKGHHSQKGVGTNEMIPDKNRITSDNTTALNCRQPLIEDTQIISSNTDIASKTKKKQTLPLEKKENFKKYEVKKQITQETENDYEEFAEYQTHLQDNKTHAQRMQEFYEFEEKLLGFEKPQTNVHFIEETCQKIELKDSQTKYLTSQSNVTSQNNSNEKTAASTKQFQNDMIKNKFSLRTSNLTTEEKKIADQRKDSNSKDKETIKVLGGEKPSIRNEPIPNRLCKDIPSISLSNTQVNKITINYSDNLSTSNNDISKCTTKTIGNESSKLSKSSTKLGLVNNTKNKIKAENNDSIKNNHFTKMQSEKIVATEIKNQLIQTNSTGQSIHPYRTGQSIIVNEKNSNLPTTEPIIFIRGKQNSETTPEKAENLVSRTIIQANTAIKKTDNNNEYDINPKMSNKVKSQKYNGATKYADKKRPDTLTKSTSEVFNKEAAKILTNIEKISNQENISLNINMLKQIYDTGMKELCEGPMESNLDETNKRQNDLQSQSNFYSGCTKILQNDSMIVYAPKKSISAESVLMNKKQNEAQAAQLNMSSPILKTMLKAVVYTVFNNRNPLDQLIESEMINSKESETICKKEEKEEDKKCNTENELPSRLLNDEVNEIEHEQDNENQYLMPINCTRFPMINDNKMMFEYPKSPVAKIIKYNDEMAFKHVPSVSKILNGTLPQSTQKELENWKINHITTLGKTQFKDYYRDQIKNDIQFHDCIRRHILGTPLNILTESANLRVKGCLRSLQGILPKLKNVTVLESPVVHPVLPYHGIVDCVACYNENPVLIEWKQADRSRPIKELMYDVPLQLSAYIGAINHDQHYKIPVKSGIIVVAYTDGSPADVLTLTNKQLEENWRIWLERLELYMASK